MEKKRITFIINPISGTKGKGTIVRNIAEVLNRQYFDYKILYSEHAGHAEQLSRQEAKNGTDIVVAVGGDGKRSGQRAYRFGNGSGNHTLRFG